MLISKPLNPLFVASIGTAAGTAAYSQFPEDLFPGMSSDGTDMTIPIAALADYGLTAAHCVAGSGDPRQLSFCMTARIKDWWTDLPEAERPEAMETVVRRTVGLSATNYEDIPRDEYTLSYYIDWPNKVVADEPE